jgi:hypothetical protein
VGDTADSESWNSFSADSDSGPIPFSDIKMLRFAFGVVVTMAFVGVVTAYAPSSFLPLRTHAARSASSVMQRIGTVSLKRNILSSCRAQASDQMTGAKFEETVSSTCPTISVY